MASLLSSLNDNLSEGLHSDNCTNCESRLEYISAKDELSLLIV